MKLLPTESAPGGRRFRPVVVLVAIAMVSTGAVDTVWAQGGEAAEASSAAEAATFLLVPLGARNVGLGGAYAGAAADVEGALWNPAALAGVEEWAVYYHGANDFGTATHAIGGVVPWQSFRLGVSLLAVDLGTVDGRDAANQPIGTIEPANTLAILSIARAMSSDVEVGVSYKLVRQTGSCAGCSGIEPDATGHAFDVSVAARPPSFRRLRLGLIVSNLGPGIAYRSGGPTDPLPARVRLGGEIEILPTVPERDIKLRGRADLQQTFTEFDDLDLYAGVELEYRSVAFLRAGHAAAGTGRSGIALGIGVRYLGFGLDVGRSFDDFAGFDGDSPFQVSVSYQP